MKLGTLVVYVKNAIDEGNWFKKLGQRVDEKSAEYVVVDLGDGLELEMHSASSESDTEFVDEANRLPRFSGIYLYLRTSDIDSDFDKLQALSPHDAVVKRPWGNREFLLESPSGLKVMVYTLPAGRTQRAEYDWH